MKKIKKIGVLVSLFLLTIYNSCFADVVMPGQTKHPAPLGKYNASHSAPEPTVNYFNIGVIVVLVIVIIICSIILIKRFTKKKKEQEKENTNNQ